MKLILTLIIAALTVLSANANNLSYKKLGLKDYDEIQKILTPHYEVVRTIKNSNDESLDSKAVEHLRQALLVILTRPNSDNMVSKLYPKAEKELRSLNAYHDTIASIASEAINTLQSKDIRTDSRTSALFILNNLLSEMKPRAKDSEDVIKVLYKIKDSKIEASKDIKRALRKRMMSTPLKPWKIAEKILKSVENQPNK